MPNRRVRVRKDKVFACMTCSLCNNLLADATTISLCLHTFCKKCIYGKFSDEEWESCPVCGINLGCNPVDKLRPDHNLQHIRAKLFPIENQAVETPSSIPSASSPLVKRKERSLSSLGVDSPRTPSHSGVTGRRFRDGGRQPSALNGSSPATEETPKNDNKEDSEGEKDEEPCSHETLNIIVLNKNQLSSSTKSSTAQVPGCESENSKDLWDTKADSWKPLNCLLNVANETNKSISHHSSQSKTEQLSAPDTDMCHLVPDVEENGCKQEAQDSKVSVPTSGPVRLKCKKQVRKSKKNATSLGDSLTPPHFIIESTNQLRPNLPLWFSLVASRDLEANESLPQLRANFLRIKNGKMPVSLIQKYIASKLDLPNDTEVEIMCQGHPVLPSLQLRNLLELWLTTAHNSAKRIKTGVGHSGKDYVMVLSYSRKPRDQDSVQVQPTESPLDNDATVATLIAKRPS